MPCQKDNKGVLNEIKKIQQEQEDAEKRMLDLVSGTFLKKKKDIEDKNK